MSINVLNDVIYGQISISNEEMKIIDTEAFQRLREVCQLTLSEKVFNGATHTRFAHSIGVFHMCQKYGRHLFPNDPKRQQIVRLAGLLHDIGHGPFSHGWDRAIYKEIYPGVEKGHDLHRYEIVKKFFKKEIEACGVNVGDVIAVWKGEDAVAKAIVNGPCGADRMDFIRRDSYHCGTVHFGTIAADRIILSSCIKERNGKEYLHFKEKVLTDILQTILARFSQYSAVYYHKTVTAASLMMEQAIYESKDVLNFVERTKDLDRFIELTDNRVIYEILLMDQVNNKAKEWVKRLKKRQLLKLFWEKTVTRSFIQTFAEQQNISFSEASKKLTNELCQKECGVEIENNDDFIVDHERVLITIDTEAFDRDHVYIETTEGDSVTFRQKIESRKHFEMFCKPENEDIVWLRVFSESHRSLKRQKI